MIKKIGWLLLIALIVIQFFRPAKNVNATPSATSIASVYPMPDDVKQLMNTACNDCHTNNTNYPWYANIQPVNWWLNDHIQEGKKELNFDEFANYRPRRQYHKMEEVIEQVKEGEMPLNSYTWIHKNAILTQPQKEQLTAWAQSVMTAMQQKYPMDSLVKKK
jgi:mono/diheme cytochrome c family protein